MPTKKVNLMKVNANDPKRSTAMPRRNNKPMIRKM
jgi:hypothetical protein